METGDQCLAVASYAGLEAPPTFEDKLRRYLAMSKKTHPWNMKLWLVILSQGIFLIAFMIVTVVVAFVVWLLWNPRWWIYLLFLWAGPFSLFGDLVNIWYYKKKLKCLPK